MLDSVTNINYISNLTLEKHSNVLIFSMNVY
jgi:hypothetical protein